MTLEVVIRRAAVSDADSIASVYLASRKLFVAFAPLIHSDSEIYAWVYEVLIPNNIVFVAEMNNVIVGMMAIRIIDNQNWIDQLYLIPDAVGKGIGAQFIEKAKEILVGAIFLRTFQENKLARHFYEKHGFKIIEQSDGSDNEERCPDLLYVYEVK